MVVTEVINLPTGISYNSSNFLLFSLTGDDSSGDDLLLVSIGALDSHTALLLALKLVLVRTFALGLLGVVGSDDE